MSNFKLHIPFYHIIQQIHCSHLLLIYNLSINQSGSQTLMPHQLACRIDVSSFGQEQGGKGSVPNLFEGLILPSFYLYMVSACKINKKKQAYNTFATNLQQKTAKKQAYQTYHNYFLLFFICQTHISVRLFQFFKKYEYFCKRFTGKIFNYKQDESTNIIKRDGKKKGCFISRFPYFPANHGRIWISGTDHLESAYHITTVAEEG